MTLKGQSGVVCLNTIEFNLLREVEERKSPGIMLQVLGYCHTLYALVLPFIFFISRRHARKPTLRKAYIWYRQQTGTKVTIQPLSVVFKAGVLTTSSSLYPVVLRCMAV